MVWGGGGSGVGLSSWQQMCILGEYSQGGVGYIGVGEVEVEETCAASRYALN